MDNQNMLIENNEFEDFAKHLDSHWIIDGYKLNGEPVYTLEPNKVKEVK